jgi:hypothetical protein
MIAAIYLAVAVVGLIPDETKQRAISRVWDATFGREDLTRAEAVAGCANYIEEAADQFDRGGRPAIAEALREAARGMVRAHNG